MPIAPLEPAAALLSPAGRLLRVVIGLAATVLVASACSGERPVLVQPPEAAAAAEQPTTTATVPLPERTDCTTTTGSGPAQAVIGVGDVPCIAVAAHHRILLANQSVDPLELTVGATTVSVAPGTEELSGAAGTLLTAGPNRIQAGEATVALIWLVDPFEDSLSGDSIGLNSIGAVELGMGPAEVTAAVGGPPVPAAGTPCHLTSLEGDPYSPLFTFRDGQLVVVQVFTPGLATRSGISVGSTSADIAAAYGERIEALPAPDGDPARQLLVFVPSDEDDQIYRLVFDLVDDQVASLRFGATEIVADQPGCSP